MNLIRIHLAFAIMASIGISAEPPENEENTGALSNLIAAWKIHSESTQELEAKLEVTHGMYSSFANIQNEWISRDTTISASKASKLVIQGSKVRYDSIGWTYDEHLMEMPIFDFQKDFGDCLGMRGKLATGRFHRGLYSHFQNMKEQQREPQQFTCWFDGSQRSNLWDGNGENHPREIIQMKPSPKTSDFAYRAVFFQACLDGGVDLDNLIYQPAILMYRPFEPWFGGIDPKHCSVTDKAVINGRSCWILEERPQVKDAFRRHFFVDAERNWIVTRYVGDAGAHGKLQFDIDYQQDSSADWVPQGWHIMRIERNDRPVQSYVSVRLTECKMTKDAGSVDFEPSIPRGTWIVDWLNATQALIRADGSERPILELESNVRSSYDVLMNSEPGEGYFEEQRRSPLGLFGYVWRSESLLILGTALCAFAGSPMRVTRQRNPAVAPVAANSLGSSDAPKN